MGELKRGAAYHASRGAFRSRPLPYRRRLVRVGRKERTLARPDDSGRQVFGTLAPSDAS
jgi:hypothetical protein